MIVPVVISSGSGTGNWLLTGALEIKRLLSPIGKSSIQLSVVHLTQGGDDYFSSIPTIERKQTKTPGSSVTAGTELLISVVTSKNNTFVTAVIDSADKIINKISLFVFPTKIKIQFMLVFHKTIIKILTTRIKNELVCLSIYAKNEKIFS